MQMYFSFCCFDWFWKTKVIIFVTFRWKVSKTRSAFSVTVFLIHLNILSLPWFRYKICIRAFVKYHKLSYGIYASLLLITQTADK